MNEWIIKQISTGNLNVALPKKENKTKLSNEIIMKSYKTWEII